MEAMIGGLDTNTIIMAVVAVVVYVIRGGTGGEFVDQILALIQKLLNRPQGEAMGECTHNLDTIEGMVMAVKALQYKLTEVGEGELVNKLDAALPKLVTSQRSKI